MAEGTREDAGAGMKAIEDLYPLTPMQELMLARTLSSSGGGVLVNQVACDVHGPLDAAAFAAAWQDVVGRHASLRTVFLWKDLKRPMQAVRKSATLTCEIEDWRASSPAGQSTRWDTFMKEDAARGIDASKAPLMRVTTVCLNEAHHRMVWTSHHLVLDRWCIAVVLDEVLALYTARLQGSSAQLPAARPFKDYVAWLQRQDVRRAEAFWRDQLRGITQPALLCGRPSGTTGYGLVHATLSPDSAARAKRFARAHQLTLSTLMTGAWGVTLANHTGRHDLLLGTTVSGRPAGLPGVENMLGSFVNTVPLRVKIDAATPISQFLRELQSRQLHMRPFEHVAPTQLVEWSELPPGAPMFESLFIFQAPVRLAPTPATDIRLVPLPGQLNSGMPLTLAVTDEGDALSVTAAYDQSRFDQEIVSRVTDSFEKSLDDLCAHGDAVLSRVLHDKICTNDQAGKATPPDVTPVNVEPLKARNAVEVNVARAWEQVLGRRGIGVNEDFFSLGGTSLQALQLITLLEKVFERKLPFAALFQAPTIEKLSILAEGGGAVERWTSLTPIQPSGRKTPIFLVHHGGGGTYTYGVLGRHMHPEQPLYGLEQIGIAEGQTPHDSIEAMAAHYVEEVRSVQPRGPYALGGFCFGGVVAFEMAQQLSRSGERVALLALIDALNPNYVADDALRRRLQKHAGRMHHMTLPQKAGYLARRAFDRAYWATANKLNGLRDKWHESAYQLYANSYRPIPDRLRQLHLLRLNGRLNDAYTAQPYDGDALLIRSRGNDHLPADFAWGSIVSGVLDIRVMPTGDHLDMLADPYVAALAEHLQIAADRAFQMQVATHRSTQPV